MVAEHRRLQPDPSLELDERRLGIDRPCRITLDVQKPAVHGADQRRSQAGLIASMRVERVDDVAADNDLPFAELTLARRRRQRIERDRLRINVRMDRVLRDRHRRSPGRRRTTRRGRR